MYNDVVWANGEEGLQRYTYQILFVSILSSVWELLAWLSVGFGAFGLCAWESNISSIPLAERFVRSIQPWLESLSTLFSALYSVQNEFDEAEFGQVRLRNLKWSLC